MPSITFLPGNHVCEVESGTALQSAAEQAGVNISFPCAGKGVCGKCIVKITSGSVAFEDNGKLPETLRRQGYVLTCRSKASDGNATVLLTSSLSEEKGQFTDALGCIGIEEELFPQQEDIKPLAAADRVTVAPPEQMDGLGDYDRFINAVSRDLLSKETDIPLNLLQKLPEELRLNDGELYVWHAKRLNTEYIVDISAAEPSGDYGLAIDIGTTTVVVLLADMASARAIDAVTLYNAQIDRGADVISRISYAKNPDRIREMRSLVLSTINRGISELTARNGNIPAHCIRNVSIAGNTTMTQLFMGIKPEYIRLDPYTPAVMGVPLYTAEALGLVINPCALIWFSPNVGSYVGGDITSGLLCTDFAVGTDEVCLFIDVGTNGEIVLGNNDFLMGCACSAGPAFEGGGIERGMRASEGAIERVEVDPVSGECSISVIGGGKPLGICGSGIISLLAQLFSADIIDRRGKLDRTGKFTSIKVSGKHARYYVTPAEGEDLGVYLTENDIDNFVRAKAAIFSACVTMLKSVSLDFSCITKFYIAGGFGKYIEIEKAQTLGLLPPLDKDRFYYIGNSSLAGAFMSLLSQKHRDKVEELANRITYVDLSVEPGYMDEYVAAMFLPHTDMSMFGKG
ncbi:ferredoxin [Synergistales bacterium]|nr:ferredoxin [Synergistales bacterium]